MLKETFLVLMSKYTDSVDVKEELWKEIEKRYISRKRHYHNLSHLENLLFQLNEVKHEIENWDAILFTLFYHDVIYNTLSSDNEAKSAEFAEKRMKQLSVPLETIELSKDQILATKTHIKSYLLDTNYFLDADLSVLGQDWEMYSEYFRNVRKEYAIYPDFIYKSGRKKVLTHFLSMDRIFKTDHFFNKFELKAKENLQKELVLMDNGEWIMENG